MKVHTIILMVLAIALVIVFANFDPNKNFFPRCPLFALTGIKCPGCGSQRAIYSLMHGQFKDAFFYNPLMIISLPYIILGLLHQYTNLINHQNAIIKMLFGGKAIKIILLIVVGYFIGRNLWS
jgi:hypothetical protein